MDGTEGGWTHKRELRSIKRLCYVWSVNRSSKTDSDKTPNGRTRLPIGMSRPFSCSAENLSDLPETLNSLVESAFLCFCLGRWLPWKERKYIVRNMGIQAYANYACHDDFSLCVVSLITFWFTPKVWQDKSALYKCRSHFIFSPPTSVSS